MDNLYETKKYSTIGWILSVILHVGLCILFLFITVDMTPRASEFVEVTISSQEAAAEIPNITPELTQPPPTPSTQGSAQEQKTRVVDIPKRVTLNTEKDKIPVDVKDKLLAQESAQRLAAQIDPLKGISKESQTLKENPLAGERRLPGTQTIETDKKMVTKPPTENIAGEIKIDKPYEILWEGGTRELINETLPEFPANVQKEVVLKFRIEVLPNGMVREVIPLSKGDARLESVTKQVLKLWMFNPLEKSAPQESQFGIISFRFILK